jgi:hypothetical protein
VMLGYAAAYEALGETGEAHRALIREDVMELVQELMLERDVPVRITLDGVPIPAFTIHMRYAVVAPMEMSSGAVQIILETSDLGAAEMSGFQEFMPNLGHLVSQIPLLGWATNIPRSSSAIMLSSFFRVAMLVTDGVPGFEADHDAFVDYYYHHTGEGGNVTDWLNVARTWSYTSACGDAYYGNNISMQPMYNWARFESDLTVRQGVLYDVLEGRMWSSFESTKNSFFSFIYAGNVPTHAAPVVTSAVDQLSQFPLPPYVKVTRDLRSDPDYMPHEEGCEDQAGHHTAVDVGERCAADFIWQSKPWDLVCTGDPYTVYPGVDYLVAYWMGRRHGFMDDDAAGRCLAWH